MNSKQRKLLEKAAHPLSPVVIVGQGGATEAVETMLSTQLSQHELVKLKFNEYKDEKRELAENLEKATASTLVRIIGNVAIFYREHPEAEKQRFKKQLDKLA